MLFIVDDGRTWLFVSAMLVLALADSAAALAGVRFGKIIYQTVPGEHKSLEGTLAFFVVGCAAVFLSLDLLSDIPRLNCALIALLMALLLAGIEAVSVGGTDNLFVPIGTCFLFHKLPDKPPVEIAFQCVSLVLLACLVAAANARRGTFHVRQLIIIILATYAAWSLGSVEWMIPCLVGFLVYDFACRKCGPLPEDFTARELFRPLYPSLIILFAANATMQLDFWYVPFLAATATSASFSVLNRHWLSSRHIPVRRAGLVAACIVPSAIPILLCCLFQGATPLLVFPVVVPLCALAVILYNGAGRSLGLTIVRSWATPLSAGLMALIAAGLQQIDAICCLEPMKWMDVFR